jgi:hypothetical protein
VGEDVEESGGLENTKAGGEEAPHADEECGGAAAEFEGEVAPIPKGA